MENNTLKLDDLIRAYLRFKEWMDYDVEHSVYCAKEIIVMQELFGTAYIIVPVDLVTAGYEKLLCAMKKRQTALMALTEAIDKSASETEIDDLLRVVDKTSFISTIHYFSTLHESIWQTTDIVQLQVESDQEKLVIDTEPIEDYFDEMNEVAFEDIRAFIVSEHPKIEFMNFPIDKAHAMGLPRRAPEPINYEIH